MRSLHSLSRHSSRAARRGLRGARGTPRTAAGLAAAIALTAAIAGCSGTPAAPAVASLPGHMASAAEQLQVDRQAPVHLAGHSGLSIDMPTRDSATQSAYSACTHFIQPIIQLKEAGAVAQASAMLPAVS